jgi:hypothetical protein
VTKWFVVMVALVVLFVCDFWVHCCSVVCVIVV